MKITIVTGPWFPVPPIRAGKILCVPLFPPRNQKSLFDRSSLYGSVKDYFVCFFNPSLFLRFWECIGAITAFSLAGAPLTDNSSFRCDSLLADVFLSRAYFHKSCDLDTGRSRNPQQMLTEPGQVQKGVTTPPC